MIAIINEDMEEFLQKASGALKSAAPKMAKMLPALKQAAVWGGSSALATKATAGDDKAAKQFMTPEKQREERKKQLKALGISGLIGGAAGAAGALV